MAKGKDKAERREKGKDKAAAKQERQEKRKHVEVAVSMAGADKRARGGGADAGAPPAVGPFVLALASATPEAGAEAGWRFAAYGAPEQAAQLASGELDPEAPPVYVVSRQPGATLVGTTQAPPQAAADKATYAVGLYNRQTHTLRLAGAAGGCVVRVEAAAAHARDAEVAGVRPAAAEQRRAPRERDLATRRAEARKLVEAFGSTRRKRQLKQREEAAVQVDRNADEERLALLLEEVTARATATGETRQEIMARVGGARVIPTHDPAARSPGEAYRLGAMFPDSLLAALNIGQLLHAAEKADDRLKLATKGAVPGYVMSRLTRIADAADQAERKRRARALALLAALLQLATGRPRLALKPPRPAEEEGGKPRPGGLEELAWSLKLGRRDVLEPLLGMFYNKTMDGGGVSFVREEVKQQLLLMHVLVVALAAEGWVLPPAQFEGLRKELKMTAGDVVSRFRELGCVCTAAKLAGAGADGTPGAAVTAYTVALLQDGSKTLEESFPKSKAPPKQRGGGR
ncbi:hypothetical protein HT031_004277 [Scenedesmus sp. PABB004]|nr:hypothetical protein HT031_004277 [Scenedesmus sp. PABB004]